MKTKNRRRIIYIKRRFQLEIIVKIIIVWFIGVVISGLLIYFFSGETLTTRYENSQLVIDRTGNVILRDLLNASAINLLVVVAVGVFISLYISHRLAGPLYRFERSMEAMRDGDLAFQVKLRDKDELIDLVPIFNQTLQRWDENFRAMKQKADALGTWFEEQEQREDLEQGQRLASELRALLHQFRTSDEK